MSAEPASRGRTGALAIAAAIAAAGAIAIASTRSHPTATCGETAHEIDATWGDAQRAAMRRAFDASGNPRAKATADRVATILDAYAARWTAMRTSSCMATRVRKVQSEEAYALRAACLDQRASELAATVDLFAKASAELVDDAVTAASGLGDLEACSDVWTLGAAYASPADPALRARVGAIRRTIAEGTALMNARALDEAATKLSGAAMEAKAIGDRRLEGVALLSIGRVDVARGEAKVAVGELLEAASRANVVRDDATEALAWIWLVRAAGYDLGRADEAAIYARLAENAIERAGGSTAMSADLVRHRAHVLYARGDLEHAEPLYREALALREKAYGASSPEIAVVEMDLADVASARGHERDAIAMYERAIARRAVAYGEGNPALVTALSNAANAYVALGDADGAARAAKRALAAAREEDSAHAHASVALACATLIEGDEPGATRIADVALAEFARVRGDDSWLLAEAHDVWGATLLRRRFAERALREADAAIAILIQGSTAPDELRDARRLRALAMARLGREGAIDEATRAIEEEERASGAASGALVVPLLAVGEASLAARHAARALDALERAATIAATLDRDPELHADVEQALARAIVATGGDAARARELAEGAARGYDETRLADAARGARAFAASIGAGAR